MAPIRVLLVEDNEVYRSSLELVLGLQEGLLVVGCVAEGAAAGEAAAALEADVALVDFRLADVDGEAAVVCLTAEATDEERAAVLAAGAAALVEKGEPIERLVAAVREAAKEEP